MSAISLIQPDRDLFSWPQYWAACFGPAPFLPMSRDEMDQLGWDSCDIILVTGDAYVDHPSFGMAICGRMLEAQGFAAVRPVCAVPRITTTGLILCVVQC